MELKEARNAAKNDAKVAVRCGIELDLVGVGRPRGDPELRRLQSNSAVTARPSNRMIVERTGCHGDVGLLTGLLVRCGVVTVGSGLGAALCSASSQLCQRVHIHKYGLTVRLVLSPNSVTVAGYLVTRCLKASAYFWLRPVMEDWKLFWTCPFLKLNIGHSHRIARVNQHPTSKKHVVKFTTRRVWGGIELRNTREICKIMSKLLYMQMNTRKVQFASAHWIELRTSPE